MKNGWRKSSSRRTERVLFCRCWNRTSWSRKVYIRSTPQPFFYRTIFRDPATFSARSRDACTFLCSSNPRITQEVTHIWPWYSHSLYCAFSRHSSSIQCSFRYAGQLWIATLISDPVMYLKAKQRAREQVSSVRTPLGLQIKHIQFFSSSSSSCFFRESRDSKKAEGARKGRLRGEYDSGGMWRAALLFGVLFWLGCSTVDARTGSVSGGLGE